MKFKEKLKAIKNTKFKDLKNFNLKEMNQHLKDVSEIKKQNEEIILNQRILIKMLKNLKNEEENTQK